MQISRSKKYTAALPWFSFESVLVIFFLVLTGAASVVNNVNLSLFCSNVRLGVSERPFSTSDFGVDGCSVFCSFEPSDLVAEPLLWVFADSTVGSSDSNLCVKLPLADMLSTSGLCLSFSGLVCLRSSGIKDGLSV